MNAIPEEHFKQVMELKCADADQKDKILQILARPEPKAKPVRTIEDGLRGLEQILRDQLSSGWVTYGSNAIPPNRVYVTSTPTAINVEALEDDLPF